MILLTVLTLPFMLREPIDLPSDSFSGTYTNFRQNQYPYAPKARKINEETKKKKIKEVVSEQAPPAAKAKEKPQTQNTFTKNEKKRTKRNSKKNREEDKTSDKRQSSEFEKETI